MDRILHKILDEVIRKKCVHPSQVSTNISRAGAVIARRVTFTTVRQTFFKNLLTENPTILRKKAKRKNKQHTDTKIAVIKVDSGGKPAFKQI